MNIDQIHRITVIGAGTMGAGIAQLAAQSGYETILFDVMDEATRQGLKTINENLQVAIARKKISEEQKEKTLSRIVITTDVNHVAADVVIEAIIERIEIKRELFRKLLLVLDEDAIICSNTSSIPISALAAGMVHPERFAGMHFFNPAHLMRLVEIISGESTSTENAHCLFDLALKMGKEPVMVKDSPGFIVNRIGKLYHTESLKLLEEKVAEVEVIDELLESSGFKMGPFRLMDLIGLDANLNVTKSLYEQFHHHPKFRPSAIQQHLVDLGFLGKKTSRGFYKYE